MSQEEGRNVIDGIEDMLGKEAAERIKEMKHGENMLTGGKGAYESVMKILAKAVNKEDEYRQALLLSTFLSREDATRVVAALDERRRYGVDIRPVIDLVTAWAAVQGARGGRIDSLIEGQTHQSISTNLQAFKNRFSKKDKDNPLS